MSTKVLIDLQYFDAYYFDDPGDVPGTPPTGYTLKPHVERWIRENGGCDGWRMVDLEPIHGSFDLFVEVAFSIPETAAKFRQQFPPDKFYHDIILRAENRDDSTAQHGMEDRSDR